MRSVPTDSDDGSSTETASMDSTTDTANGIAIVMKDKQTHHEMKHKYERVYNKPLHITYTRTYYGKKQYHDLKKCILGMMLK